jgi:hypothetical protein
VKFSSTADHHGADAARSREYLELFPIFLFALTDKNPVWNVPAATISYRANPVL